MAMESLSKIDPRLTLDFILNKREDQFFEKKGWHEGGSLKPSKLANELIGMLNASGGVLVLGISDKGSINDLNGLAPEVLDQYRKVVHDCIEPPANVETEEIALPTGELIFLYHVEQNHERLYKRRGNEEVFLRVGGQQQRASQPGGGQETRIQQIHPLLRGRGEGGI